MKPWISALLVCCILLAGCGQKVAQPTAFPTAERPPSPVVAATLMQSPPLDEEDTATPTPEAEVAQTPSSSHQALKAAWRPAIQNAIILSSACEWMFETHTKFQQGEIDIEEARSELSIEADLISFVRLDSLEAYQDDTVAEFMWGLETEMYDLIELIDGTDDEVIGSSEVLDDLLMKCGSLLDLQTAIVLAAMEAGLTLDEIDELDLSDSEMFLDLYGRIMEGN
jgi:hypothetical protein